MLGFNAYAKWCGMFQRQPMAITEFSADVGFHRTGAYRFVNTLYKGGLMHIAEWRMEPGKMILPRFKFGRGTDAPFPEKRPDGKAVDWKPRKIYAEDSKEMGRFLAALLALEKVGTAVEVSAQSGIELQTARKLLAELVRSGVAAIVGWDQVARSSNWVPSYQLGAGRSVPRPRKRCKLELNREWRARKKRLQDSTLLMRVWAPMKEAA